MTDEQEQQPRTFREIADEMNGRAMSRRDRLDHTPIRDIDYDKVDRPLDMNDERALDSIEPPRFRNIREAAEFRANERKERAAQAEAEALHQYHEREQQVDELVRRTETWSSPEEQQAISEFQQRHQAWDRGRAEIVQAAHQIGGHARKLAEAGQHQEARDLIQRWSQNVAGRVQELNQTEAALNADVQRGLKDQATKQNTAGMIELARLHPEVMDATFREAFVAWCVNDMKIPRKMVLAEKDPANLAACIREYKKVEKQRYEREVHRRIAANNPIRRGAGSVNTLEEARAERRRTGSPDAALNAMRVQNLYRQYGLI